MCAADFDGLWRKFGEFRSSPHNHMESQPSSRFGLVFVAAAIGALTIGTGSGVSYATTVSVTGRANDLAAILLGDGIELSADAVLTGAIGAAGTFTGGGSVPLGFSSGIILSTGDATLAEVPSNVWTSAGTDNGAAGDDQLTGLVGAETFDAVSLEFTFRFSDPEKARNLYFNYVFASEEYNEWVDQGFNDVFAFFLDGTNIALLPGTTTPVSVDNVNSIRNSTFYRNNRLGDSLWDAGLAGAYRTEYDGLTRVLTASALDLDPGNHTIRLAIADTGDHIYDSAVFIQAGTFDNAEHEHESEDVPDAGSTAALLSSAFAALAALRRKFACASS